MHLSIFLSLKLDDLLGYILHGYDEFMMTVKHFTYNQSIAFPYHAYLKNNIPKLSYQQCPSTRAKQGAKRAPGNQRGRIPPFQYNSFPREL